MNRIAQKTTLDSTRMSAALSIATLTLGLNVGGCVLDDSETSLRANTYEISIGNGLPGNGLPGNGLPGNGLPGNGLPGNGLPGNGLPDSSLPSNGLASSQLDQSWENWLNDVERGQLHDTLMKYVSRCALSDWDSATYTDSNNNTWYWDGLLGLAPKWGNAGITLAEQRWVSSCVAALVNRDSQNVQISVRGPISSAYKVTNSEVLNWNKLEGAFFGNMFANIPVYYSCSSGESYTNSENGRVCTMVDAHGDSMCAPIEALGACSDICSSLTIQEPGIASYVVFYDCEDPSGIVWAEVTTVAQLGD